MCWRVRFLKKVTSAWGPDCESYFITPTGVGAGARPVTTDMPLEARAAANASASYQSLHQS